MSDTSNTSDTPNTPNTPDKPEGSNIPDTHHARDTYPTDRASLERDCDTEFVIAGGPGGQHRNKVETGVRLTHRPTGITVTATERRSQYANREAAYERMAQRLEARQRVQPERKPTRPTAASRARRLDEKRRSGRIKKLRSTPPGE